MFVLLKNHAKLLKVFEASEEITGRKKLQKMVYILKKVGFPFEEKYAFHFYGPYSEELSLRTEELCNLGFIDEIKEKKSNYTQYRYQVTDQGEMFLKESTLDMPPVDEKIAALKEESSRFLELVATMLYFEPATKAEVEKKVQEVKKKSNYTEEDLEKAWTFIDKMKQ